VKRISRFYWFIKTIGVMCLFTGTLVAQENVDFTSSNLPIVIIDTNGQSIGNSRKIVAHMGIIYNGPGKRNNVSDPCNQYDGRIAIEYRGDSSQQWSKKQFGLETQDSLGANLNVSLLGMPKENDWILYAPYSDKSLMRNVLAYKLSRELGHYATRTQYCELVLNGRYWGIYVLFEKIKRDKNRVNIAKLDSTDVDSLALTGGYIIKVDKTAGENVGGWPSKAPLYFPGATSPKPYYQYHYPKPDEIMPQQAEYIKGFITNFENMMMSDGYDDPAGGMWTALEMGSVIDLCIVNEVSKNVDGYRLSSYLYKDRDDKDPRLYVGPAWDYNLAFGNADYYSATAINGWQIEYFMNNEGFNKGGDSYMMPFWWGKIWDSARFQNKLYRRWWEMRQTVLNVDYLLTFIDDTAAQLDEAQQRNFACWPILGTYVWPNVYIGQTYQDEVTYLKTWLQDRIEWMDDQLKFTAADVEAISANPSVFKLKQNYPNPFNSSTTISFTLDRPSHVELAVYNLEGQLVQTLLDEIMPAGEHRAIFTGDNLASGIYFCRMATQDGWQVQKLVLQR
jgi:hypothetical protein